MSTSLRTLLLSRPSRPPASILSQFSAGEQGGIWLPSFSKSLFQDAGMTIPASVGGAVVKMLDLSGRGNHVTFTNVTLQRDEAGLLYLAADGSTSSGVTGSIDLSGTDKFTAVTGVRKLSDADTGVVCEFSDNTITNNGTFYILAPNTATATYGVATKGTSANGIASASSYTAPISNVVTLTGDIAAPLTLFRISGTQSAASAATLGTGTFGNYPLYFFARAGSTLRFNGRFYGLILRGAASTAGQIADTERYIALLTGVNF